MIRYVLACDSGHEFESWFPSSHGYDEQVADGLVACPLCGSREVGKTLMSPALGRKQKSSSVVPVPVSPESVPMIGEPERQLRDMLRTMHEHVRRTADDVGGRFAAEARSMHYGDIPHRSIYGQASLDEARTLIDEGIDVCPLPPMPDDRN